MTFGTFIARVYDACGERRAGGVVRFALKSHRVEFHRGARLVIRWRPHSRGHAHATWSVGLR